MNACLHLASHAGTVHDLAPATHVNCPPLQLHRPHRPLHALKHAMHNVVHSREARGLQTVPTPNPHATNTYAEYAQAASPWYLQRPRWRSGRWRPRSKLLQKSVLHVAGEDACHCGRLPLLPLLPQTWRTPEMGCCGGFAGRSYGWAGVHDNAATSSAPGGQRRRRLALSAQRGGRRGQAPGGYASRRSPPSLASDETDL